jgi:hypothetical protein
VSPLPAAARPRALLLEALRAAGALVAVLAAAAVALAAVDAVPAWLAGESREVRRARTVDDVERRLRTRLLVPFYFPSTLAWPPERVRWVAGPPGAVLLEVKRHGGGPRLLLAQTVAPGAVPGRLLPEAQVLSRSPVAVGAAEGTLSRVVDEGGGVAWEVAWEQGGRSVVLRSRGSLDELLRMARSAREAP